MVYVQSFWSKPFLNTDSNEYNYRVSGGFIDKRYFYYCWTLSFLSLKSMGEKVILVTDDLGRYLLVEALGLAYDEVQLEFNKLDDLSSAYWAIPKLHVYRSMKEPFLHFDGDLILYPGFQDLDLRERDLIFEFKHEAFSDDHLKSISYLNNVVFSRTNSYNTIFDKRSSNEAYSGQLSPGNAGVFDAQNSNAPEDTDLDRTEPGETKHGETKPGETHPQDKLVRESPSYNAPARLKQPGNQEPCKVQTGETHPQDKLLKESQSNNAPARLKEPGNQESCKVQSGKTHPYKLSINDMNHRERYSEGTHSWESQSCNLPAIGINPGNEKPFKLNFNKISPYGLYSKDANPGLTHPVEINPDEKNSDEEKSDATNPVEKDLDEMNSAEMNLFEIHLRGTSQDDQCELNCGIVGGKDFRFFNHFATYSLDLFYKNLPEFDTDFLKFNKNFINSYFEQYLIYQFILTKKRKFSCIYENDPREIYLRDFFLPVGNTSRIITHLILNLKVKFSQEIEMTLRLYYPQWHARINDLINRNII